MSATTTLRLIVRGNLWTTNAERRMHPQARARAVRQWREDAAWEAKAARLPRLDRVTILATPHQVRGRLADVGSHMPAVKAIVDGLVDAGVLTDDDPAHVLEITYRPPVRAADLCDSVVLELEEVP